MSKALRLLDAWEDDAHDPDPPEALECSWEDQCKCESWTLLHFGCKCGYIDREKRRKELDRIIEEDRKKREEGRKNNKNADDDLPF